MPMERKWNAKARMDNVNQVCNQVNALKKIVAKKTMQ
jgi:hypothetical protein